MICILGTHRPLVVADRKHDKPSLQGYNLFYV